MTLDSSAVVAIVFAEAGYMELVDRILEAEVVRIGAPTLVGTCVVVAARRRKPAAPEVEELIRELGVAISPFGEAEWRAALDAFANYGRGRHQAGLNFGDCLAYASARASRDSLLFVGKDFRRTDITPAV